MLCVPPSVVALLCDAWGQLAAPAASACRPVQSLLRILVPRLHHPDHDHDDYQFQSCKPYPSPASFEPLLIIVLVYQQLPKPDWHPPPQCSDVEPLCVC